MSHTKIYVASAGTGKTTTLMDLLSTCLEDTKPKNIAFTTFTKGLPITALRCGIGNMGFFSAIYLGNLYKPVDISIEQQIQYC